MSETPTSEWTAEHDEAEYRMTGRYWHGCRSGCRVRVELEETYCRTTPKCVALWLLDKAMFWRQP